MHLLLSLFCGTDNVGSWICVVVTALPYDSAVFVAEKFHNRFLSADGDAFVMTVFLTTRDIIEQLLNDAELRTFGEAVILIGTVQVALNDAERCTGTIGGVRGAVNDVVIDDVGMWAMIGMGGGVYGLMGFFFGDGVHELSLC